MLASDPAGILDQIFARAGIPPHAGVNLRQSCSRLGTPFPLGVTRTDRTRTRPLEE